MKMHVKKGDTVIVISGDDRKTEKDGKKENTIAKVIATSPEEGKVIVEGEHCFQAPEGSPPGREQQHRKG